MRVAATVLGLAIGLVGLGIDLWAIVPPSLVVSETNPVARSLPGSLIWFWTYFTHLSNLGLVLVYVAVLTRWRWLGWFERLRTRALMGGYILLVMLYYHTALASLYELEGAIQVAAFILHYVAPIYYLAWWALFVPHGGLRVADLPPMLVPGLAYLAWVLLRGAIVGEYPYAIVDAGQFGYVQVGVGAGILLLAVLVLCTILVGADRLLGRLQPPRVAE